MIKKILIIFFIIFAITSCGKKGCPKNNADENCSEFFKKST